MNVQRVVISIGPRVAFVLGVVAAALAPLFANGRVSSANSSFPGWPARFEGRELRELPLTPREIAFTRDFPGRVGRFSDGEREIIVRFVDAPTRRLHPAADCLRGAGFAITPLPGRRDASGALMSCFRARLNRDSMTVCELVRDEHGTSWPDVSAWYWTALFGGDRGPWWSFVVAELD
jgi:hypothetical protein